jgi:ABC-2 type transport system permease protein
MIRLWSAEFARFWARRMTRFFPLGLAVAFVVGIVIAYAVITNNDTDLDFLEDVAGGVGAQEVLGPITIVLPLMAFVLGASYIGADSKTGMLEQILTWEPRRMRILGVRLLSSLIGVAVLAMVLSVLLIGLLIGLVVSTGGTVEGLTGEFWGNLAVIVVRTGLAAGLFACFGLGVTLLIDSSIGSIVGFVIYWFVIENFLISAFLPRVGSYLPITNANAFATGADVERIDGSVFSGDFDLVFSHTYRVAGVVLVAWVLAAVIPAAVVFDRRDVD